MPEAGRPAELPRPRRIRTLVPDHVCLCGRVVTRLRRQCFPDGDGLYCSSACKRRAASRWPFGWLLDEAGERISDSAYIYTGEPAAG